MIDRKTIDQVYMATDIVEVVSDFVSLRKSGANYKGLCPFHEEKTPSFVVTPAKGICHCFGCHKGGNAINFLMQINNMTYPEDIRWLARKYNIDVVETGLDEETTKERQHRDELLALNQWANDFFQQSLHDTSEGQGIGMTYFRSRQFRDDIIRKFQLGYCSTSGHSLVDAAQKNHLNSDNLLETGLCIKGSNDRLKDRFFGRIIFPVHNYMGKVVAFGGRVLEKKDNVGKYLNSPESLIYSKSHELYGIFFAKQSIQKLDRCYLVEGYTDVISMHQCGIENVVASSGTALTHDQIRLISKFTHNLTVLYDGDNAGIKASLRGIDMLLEHGLNIKVLLLPDGDDPDSFAQKHTAQEYVDYISNHEVDFIRFKTDLLLKDAGTDVHARAMVINNIAESIARIDDTITRSLYIKECASLTGVREEDVLETVNSQRNSLQLKKMQERQRAQNYANAAAEPPSSTEILNDSSPSATSASTSHTTIQPTAPKVQRRAASLAEENLMKYIIRYGEQPVGDFETENGEIKTLRFAECISLSMANDDLAFSNPLYNEIVQEIIAHQHTTAFRAATYMLSHPNDDIRNYALSLATDRDGDLGVDDSAIINNLFSIGNKLLCDLSIAILQDKISDIDHLIKSGTLSDSEMLEKIQEYSTYKQAQLELRKSRSRYNEHRNS